MLKELYQDFITLVYPRNCAGCGRVMMRFEKAICFYCLSDLPVTHFHKVPDNAVEKALWGRFPFVKATAYVFFEKQNKVQSMMHALKYKGNADVGLELGQQFGSIIKEAVGFAEADALVPVPLHKKKLAIRGYNQAEVIANGMGVGMEKPVYPNLLLRTKHTASQTRKGRFERYTNMKEVFALGEQPANIKHVVLVDDVTTTGSTLEGCGKILVDAGYKVSVATLGVAFG